MIDLSTPQRQSMKGLAVFLVKALKKTIKVAWPILLIALTKKGDKDLWLYYITGLVVGTSLIYNLIEFIFQRFHIDEIKQEFIIEKGLFNKSKTVIQFSKIQQVNLNQKLIHQIFDVYELEIETAGTSKTEVKLDAISDVVAELLKEKLISANAAHHQQVIIENQPEQKSTLFIKTSSLFKHGITTNYFKTFWIIVAFSLSLLDNILNYLSWDDDKIMSEVENITELQYEIKSALIGICSIFLIIVLLNLILTFIRFARYTIEKQAGNLSISYGLFDTKTSIIKPSRIQISSITQNKFQKLMDIQQFSIQQATADHKDGNKKNGIEIPGLSTNEINHLFEQLFPKKIEFSNGIKAKMIQFVMRTLIFSLLPSFLIFHHAFLEKSFFYLMIGLIYLSAMTFYYWRLYQNNRLYFNDHYILIKRGFWDVSTFILEPHKIQSISYSQYFWQKKFDSGNIKIVTAGGIIRFSSTQFKPLLTRINFWLYQVESTDKNWY